MQTAGTTATIKGGCAVFNNWRDESWFGASKTTMPIASWVAGNFMYGGVLKKLEFVGIGASGIVKCYDSRSTTAPQRGTFVGNTAFDFLAAGTTTATDANGRVWLAFVGADVATNLAITRYTGQKYTLQAFGYRVSVTSIDMTAGGDDNTSAYAPVVPTVQPGISRSEAAINAATIIDNFQQLLEELHVLALGLSGSASYAGTYNGNLFDLVNGGLQTSFSSVTVDATAASKISYNSTTNALTIKSTTLASNATVSAWTNATGTISTANGATITGTFTDSTGTRVALTNRNGVSMTSYVLVNGTAVGGSTVGGTFVPGFVPLVTSRTLTVLPADTIRMVVNAYGYKPQIVNCTGAELDKFTVTLEIESGVDVTSVSTITRNAVADIINFSQASPTQIDITLLQTLAAYFPKDCVAGVAYAFVTKGYLAFAAMAQANNANIYSLSNGQMVTYFPGFKLRMNDTAVGGAAIVPTATGYSIPLVAYYFDQATSIASPVTILNASNAKIETAPWTQATATISEQDKQAIADASATEVWTAPTRTLTSSGGATAEDIWSYATRTITSGGITLAQIEGSTVLAKEATVADKASQSSVTALGTPLQASAYTAPNNTNIAAAVWSAPTRTLTVTDTPVGTRNVRLQQLLRNKG
jgi:hypothetical protein